MSSEQDGPKLDPQRRNLTAQQEEELNLTFLFFYLSFS